MEIGKVIKIIKNVPQPIPIVIPKRKDGSENPNTGKTTPDCTSIPGLIPVILPQPKVPEKV